MTMMKQAAVFALIMCCKALHISSFPVLSTNKGWLAMKSPSRILSRPAPLFAATELSASTQTIDDMVAQNYPTFRVSDAVGKFLNAGGKTMENVVYSNDTVLQACEAMTRNNKGSVLVLDDKSKLAGIFTERDYMKRVVDAQEDPSKLSMANTMTPLTSLKTGLSTDSLSQCRQKMLQYNVRHLPILDESGAAVGVVSMREVIRALQVEDLGREKARFFGDSMEQLQLQAADEANKRAAATASQDTLRAGFVLAAGVVVAALLQGDFVHANEFLSMSLVFLLGYVGIIFETYFEFNKAGIALLMATALWVIFAGTAGATGVTVASSMAILGEKVSEVSEIIYFLLGAMTIVEVVDAHQGFKVVTDRIEGKDKRGLMRIIAGLTFFMSAILDNLTTTIVIVSLLKKLLPDIDDRKLFGALVVIAANAGGAWTPIGDVTTTMLWINGQISTFPTITGLFLPSLASVVISTLVLEKQIPDGTPVPDKPKDGQQELAPRGQLVFATGILGLLAVPVFKQLTGLPPYLGMLASLGTMWTLTDAIHAGEDERESLMAPAALKKIDTSGILFFLGILLSVGAMDAAGILRNLAEVLDQTFPIQSVVAILIGIASAVIDNVPLVAATMGMYDLNNVPMDSELWQLIAFCAGTGGSLLVIGSAAGVALMGLEKVDFLWYAKQVTLAAAAGYIGGIAVYLAQHGLAEGLMSIAQLPAATTTTDLATTVIETGSQADLPSTLVALAGNTDNIVGVLGEVVTQTASVATSTFAEIMHPILASGLF